MRNPAFPVAIACIALASLTAGCRTRGAPKGASGSPDGATRQSASAALRDASPAPAASGVVPPPEASEADQDAADIDPANDPTPPRINRVPFAPGKAASPGAPAAPRFAYIVRHKPSQKAPRLLANLHGVCNPPEYACGYWTRAASIHGTLVCPEGNSHCGAGGPPTWTQSTTLTDADLERAIAASGFAHTDRDVLTGFSLGAYAAAEIAQHHPGRWPYLILTEANVPLDAARLRKAGIRAVAMVAGELGTQIHGERLTVRRLEAQKFPARLFVMKKAGHHYSADVDEVMAAALTFVTSVQ